MFGDGWRGFTSMTKVISLTEKKLPTVYFQFICDLKEKVV